ncbi:beta-ketoacyl synthase N-terminal-like domain-containing protein [Actinopolyspora sp. H202]|uniref:beta-ketoacyl synthase N-terminal-like domain-containing protein n=1 Tax=Actinopolyspora sp. H202 TaxID=1500456 RepID=UPI003EE74258
MRQDEHASTRLGDTPIAIVGLGALYPRSGDLREFWSNVVEARDCIEEVPESHWSIADYYDPDPTAPDKTYSKRGGFIPTVPFNPMEFGLPPNTLEVTDVLQLLSLVVAKQTLHDAGAADMSREHKDRTGVVLGITGANSLTQPLATRLQTPVLKEVVRSCGLDDTAAEEIADKFTKAFAPWEENSFPGMLGNVVAGRITNRFDLGGTNCTIDAACASSLAAVRMAVDELVSGRADMMVTGGCDAENTILMYLCFSKTPALSKTDHIRPFDDSSDGTLIGEGMGMLALKRLDDAERDGDRIYSVLRGIGSSSDGRFKSIYAPREDGQVTALNRAYTDAGFGPEKVGLLECHGTGTAVGDLTELTALGRLFSGGERSQFAAVGSVKSQIGHTKAAAGAAGLIKTSLALHHKVLPPTINVETPRADADFENSPFYVSGRTRPWVLEPERERRRAGVSSFGFGGTNFHCVLEEHTPDADDLAVLHPACRVHFWHAASTAELADSLLEDAAPDDPDGEIPSTDARVAIVARTQDELDELRQDVADKLCSGSQGEPGPLPNGVHFRSEGGDPGRVAALFAGQGSQYVGMGERAAICLPPVRAGFDAASTAGDAAAPLSGAVFPPPAFDKATAERQQETLRRTDNAQPAIGALSVGQYNYLRHLGFTADGAIGHSFGELTALWCAGSLSEETFHHLAHQRGGAMAERADPDEDPGTLAAIRVGRDRVEELLGSHPDVTLCNDNSHDQVVVGGKTAAVEAFVERCRTEGIGAQLLPVAAAFHTSCVEHAVERFRETVLSSDVSAPGIPVYANTRGAEYGEDVDSNRSVLVDQLINPVDFRERIEQMYSQGFRTFVEFGPKSVLSGLVRSVLADRADVVVLSADAGPNSDSDYSLKQLAARLAVLGIPLRGFNDFTARSEPAPAPTGMNIPLNGVNHVSERRRAEYREALNNGYRITPPTAQDLPHDRDVRPDVSPVVRAEPQQLVAHSAGDDSARPEPLAERPGSGTAYHEQGNETVYRQPQGGSVGMRNDSGGTEGSIGSMASDHLSMHGEYLNSQLRIAERLSELLGERASEGGPDQHVVDGINAVTNHSLAIGRSHVHASEVLRSFAHLAAGATPQAPVADPDGSSVTAVGPSEPTDPHAGFARLGGPETAATERQALTAFSGPAVNGDGPAVNGADERNGRAVGEPRPAVGTAVADSPVVGSPVPEEPAAGVSAVEGVSEVVSSGLDVGTVREALLAIVSDKTGYPSDMLDSGMHVEADLGIDSIKRVEIMGALRERFPDAPAVSPERLAELNTLDDIVGFLAGTTEEVAEALPKA